MCVPCFVNIGVSMLAADFFFSSRRRHTRLQGDWSSDVCSSDLSRRPCHGRGRAMSTASTTLTQPTPQQLSHAVTEIGRLTLQGSSEVYSLGQLALAWLERPEGYRNLEVVANALQAICGDRKSVV